MTTATEAATTGMNTTVAHTPDEVKAALLGSITRVASANKHLTTDQVWEHFESTNGTLGKNDKSVIGPMMNLAVKNGLIERVDGATIKSERPSTHGRLLRIFRSRINAAA